MFVIRNIINRIVLFICLYFTKRWQNRLLSKHLDTKKKDENSTRHSSAAEMLAVYLLDKKKDDMSYK